ncbi:hypothetical protein ACQP08_12860 [Micromonospora zamorensis]|uniref:hypothetical protein n=1 Tax=Micromonospora zamorensis TaxID=709883 RepID=UPI003D8B8662
MQKRVEGLDIGGALSGLELPFRSMEIHPPILYSAPQQDKRVRSRQNGSSLIQALAAPTLSLAVKMGAELHRHDQAMIRHVTGGIRR